MNPRHTPHVSDRITLRHAGRPQPALTRSERRSHLWTLAGGVTGSVFLLWVMVQLGQASSEPQPKPAKPAAATTTSAAPGSAGGAETTADPTSPPATQGPAIETPREVIEMLDQRKKDLDRREAAVRQEEERLLALKTELEGLLTRNETMQKTLQESRRLHQKQTTEQKVQQDQFIAERKALYTKQAQDQKAQSQAQLAKMYESMPSEEAAARLEKMPEHKAIEILRIVKPKTAGAILSQVRVDRAAKLTEQLLVQTP
jgi:flagellar motility protein MotE (MotC chaperone)